ncbi:metallophosphoesterase family protein [Hydrogenophaga sp. PBL-H3]|uniref:metallophosphoesterase family protein n=1 Tax=Hydrogenophaga sp. PBL-H3 TaxID=434010 RepID=UPI00131FAF0C|nr:metallophosphoesterase [Hydrogenophaga sp. PBL-H3]QHE76227.1 metallophosphoesterase family protein [Hydrogenophaga sp. PBL-H3]QHE80651.1 metallophosphoesterase family protein [Hydrogenophaga sp. PBL-H3]
MKLALLSDLHANLQALDACLAHARQQGATRYALLGDLVGYGADPCAVIDRVVQLAANGALVLKGNHDALAVAPSAQGARLEDATSLWTHQQLSADQRTFLASLPLTGHIGHCWLVHASAEAPEQWRYVDDERSALASLDAATRHPGVRYVFGGHVHHQTLYYKGRSHGLMAFAPTPGVAIPTPAHRRWIATIGSVGQPRDGQPLAMYALFDAAQARLTFHRVPYDHAGAAAAVRRAGLPEYFAKRLEEGR